MKCKKHVIWSLLELSGLLEDEEARVHYERTKKHLALHPFHLTNLRAALNDVLSSSLNTYDPELKGFVLAYKNPTLLTDLGDSFFDNCFIHVDIEADFYLFRPEIGCSIKGIVNKKGLDHIILLIHKIFTVSVSKPHDVEEWLGDLVDIGQEVRCCLTQIEKNIRLPFIHATLKSDYLQGCRLPEKVHDIDNMVIESNHTDTIDSIVDASNVAMLEDDREKRKSRKKHAKKSRGDSETTVKCENNTESINNSGNGTAVSIKYEDNKQQRKNVKREYSTSNTDYSLNNTELNDAPKKRKKDKVSKVSSDSQLEMHVIKIKTEKPDSDTSDNAKSGNKLSFNSYNTDAHKNTDFNGFVKLHKGIKREHSPDTSESERKKRKKHAKKSKESNPESMSATESDGKILDNIVSTFSCEIKSENKHCERQHDNKEQRKKIKKENIVSNTDYSLDDSRLENIPKKRKKIKSKVSSDSDTESHIIKIKVEKSQMSQSIDTANNITKTIKRDDEEQAEDTKYNISSTDISSHNFDLVPKKHKKSKKMYKASDSESEQQVVKIKIDKDYDG